MSHYLEQYFVKAISPVAECLIEGVFRTLIRDTLVVLDKPANLDARANPFSGRARSAATALHHAVPRACHAIEHEVSAWHDITHGVGLAILTPRLLRFFLEEDAAFLPVLPSASWASNPPNSTRPKRWPKRGSLRLMF